MSTEQLISAIEFCERQQVDITFIQSLQEYGLIEVVVIEEQRFIHPEQLQQVEQFVRLYYDLDINLAGIDAIANLLQKVNKMNEEIRSLKNKLRLYEQE